jgi:hypothetical protein
MKNLRNLLRADESDISSDAFSCPRFRPISRSGATIARRLLDRATLCQETQDSHDSPPEKVHQNCRTSLPCTLVEP